MISDRSMTAPRRGTARLSELVLLALMAVGSLALWMAVPALCLYATGKATNSATAQFLTALPLTAIAMLAFGAVLASLNQVYLRVSGAIERHEAAEREDFAPGEAPGTLRGPLEPLLVGSLIVAIVAMAGWFFLFAENPPWVPL